MHEATPDVSQDPEGQIELLTEEQRAKQRKAQQEVANLKQELAEVQAQIEAETDTTTDNTQDTPAPTITDTTLDELQSLEERLRAEIQSAKDLARRLAQNNLRAIGLTGRIDNLSGTTFNDAEFTGTVTGLTDAHIPNDITASNYVPTSGGTLTGSITGTNATFSGTLSVSASTTFNGVEYLFLSADGTNTQVLTTDGAGGLSWTTISSGSTSSWEEFNNSGIRLATTSHQVLIGGSSTSSTAALEVSGQSYFSDNVGLGDTTPSYTLTVSGDTQVSGLVDAAHFVATSTTATSTFHGGVKLNKSGTGIEFNDGTVQKTAATDTGLRSVQTFTSDGTWTKPAGVNYIRVKLVGGGGGGAGGGPDAGDGGGGGGAGGYSEEFIDVSATSTVNVVIGSGGTGGSGSSGNDGGSTKFSTFLSATGGSGGTRGHAGSGGDGGTGSGGDINTSGGSGGSGQNDRYLSGLGGNSYFGGGAGDVYNSSGKNATGYGGGGSGGVGSNSGGNGAAGIVIIYEYK